MSSEIIDINAPIFISIGISHSSTRKLIFSGGNLPPVCLTTCMPSSESSVSPPGSSSTCLICLSHLGFSDLQVPTVAFLNLHTSNSSGPFWHSSDKFCPCVCTLPFYDWVLHSNSSSLNLASQMLATNPVNRFLLVGGICSFNVVHDAVFLSPLKFFSASSAPWSIFPRSLCMLT